MRTAIVTRAIDAAALLDEVASVANGASILFVGTVRDVNDGRAVTGIEYTAYVEMAERELACIAEEAAREYATEHIVIEHRLGHLALGEASVAIAVAHPRRAQAYDASRFVIEQLKRRVPIWKREEYVDGTREWVASGLGTRDAAIEIRDSSIEARHGGADGSSRESRVPSPAEHR